MAYMSSYFACAAQAPYKPVPCKVELPKPSVSTPELTNAMRAMIEWDRMWDALESVPYYYTYEVEEWVIVDEFPGYVTAYCSAECGGSTMTASGTTCHYSDDPDEPTTCAIDPRYHNFGDYFGVYVDGELKIYVAEDTGSAVKDWSGSRVHLDLYFPDYDSMAAWPTSKMTIYEVELQTVTYTDGPYYMQRPAGGVNGLTQESSCGSSVFAGT